MSEDAFLIAKTSMLAMTGMLSPDSSRRAIARMSGLESERSFWNVLMESSARSGSCSAYRKRYMYTSLRISRFGAATFLTTCAKYSEALRPFEMSCGRRQYDAICAGSLYTKR